MAGGSKAESPRAFHSAVTGGWLYLAVVIDFFARRSVGWAASDRLHRRLALQTLEKALTMRSPPKGLIHHSDRGSQLDKVETDRKNRRPLLAGASFEEQRYHIDQRRGPEKRAWRYPGRL